MAVIKVAIVQRMQVRVTATVIKLVPEALAAEAAQEAQPLQSVVAPAAVAAELAEEAAHAAEPTRVRRMATIISLRIKAAVVAELAAMVL